MVQQKSLFALKMGFVILLTITLTYSAYIFKKSRAVTNVEVDTSTEVNYAELTSLKYHKVTVTPDVGKNNITILILFKVPMVII